MSRTQPSSPDARQSDALDRLRQTVACQSRELRRLTLELQAAEQRERWRIAERLHQDLQQLLAAASLKLSALERQLPASNHQQALAEARALLDQAATSARSLAADLAPPALQEGIASALAWLAGKMQRDHGLRVNLQLEPDCTIPDLPRRELLFQCVRELLFNVAKHAGVGEAQVTLRHSTPGLLEAIVSDEGHRMAGRGPGFGLRNIQARLQHIGGSLQITSKPSSGTTARILLPV